MMVSMLLEGWSFWVLLVQSFVDNIAFFHYLPIGINFLWRKSYATDHSFGMRKMKKVRNIFNRWSERVYWLVWLAMRIVWYPNISVASLVTFSMYYDIFGLNATSNDGGLGAGVGGVSSGGVGDVCCLLLLWLLWLLCLLCLLCAK